MKTEQPLLITSIKASSDLSAKKNLFIGFDGAVCTNGSKPLGVLSANTNLGEMAPVISQGIALVYSGGAVALGQAVQSNGLGKAVPLASGSTIAGYSLDSATATDQLIRVLLS